MSWGFYTTERFLEKYPTGTFLIFVRGHAFCIKDGVIFGNPSDAEKLKARILQAFRVTN